MQERWMEYIENLCKNNKPQEEDIDLETDVCKRCIYMSTKIYRPNTATASIGFV